MKSSINSMLKQSLAWFVVIIFVSAQVNGRKRLEICDLSLFFIGGISIFFLSGINNNESGAGR